MAFCMVTINLPAFAASDFGSTSTSLSSNTSQIYFTEDAYNKYILGPGDIIEVHIIVGQNVLTKDYEFPISFGGTIFFPNIGEVKLSGMTISDAKTKLIKNIGKYFKENYSLSLVLKEPRMLRVYLGGDSSIPALKYYDEQYVFVYGEVQRGGRYSYFPGRKLSDYINMAGGPGTRAALDGATLTRDDLGGRKFFNVNASDVMYKGQIEKDMYVMPGDIINVPANFFYFSDFASFTSTVFMAISLYTTLQNVYNNNKK